jgi:hypothetical protein
VSERYFRFVQWEFAGRLGPDPGRYPVRLFAGDDVREIVGIGGYEAPRRSLVPFGGRRRRRARSEKEPLLEPVEVTRATVIDAAPVYDRDAAEAWLETAVREADVVEHALAVLNRAVAGHRVAAADPLLADADPARALVTRVGYGRGEQVAEGEWEAARALPSPAGRKRALVPQQRLAALLGGRDVALACEELALRARADLAAGREREAAMQAHLALEAAVVELESWREKGDMAGRLGELAGHREAVAAAANAAIQGGLEPGTVSQVEVALGRLEAALRARAAGEASG